MEATHGFQSPTPADGNLGDHRGSLEETMRKNLNSSENEDWENQIRTEQLRD